MSKTALMGIRMSVPSLLSCMSQPHLSDHVFCRHILKTKPYNGCEMKMWLGLAIPEPIPQTLQFNPYPKRLTGLDDRALATDATLPLPGSLD